MQTLIKMGAFGGKNLPKIVYRWHGEEGGMQTLIHGFWHAPKGEVLKKEMRALFNLTPYAGSPLTDHLIQNAIASSLISPLLAGTQIKHQFLGGCICYIEPMGQMPYVEVITKTTTLLTQGDEADANPRILSMTFTFDRSKHTAEGELTESVERSAFASGDALDKHWANFETSFRKSPIATTPKTNVFMRQLGGQAVIKTNGEPEDFTKLIMNVVNVERREAVEKARRAKEEQERIEAEKAEAERVRLASLLKGDSKELDAMSFADRMRLRRRGKESGA